MNIKAVVSKVENHIYWKKIEWGFYDKMDDESFLITEAASPDIASDVHWLGFLCNG